MTPVLPLALCSLASALRRLRFALCLQPPAVICLPSGVMSGAAGADRSSRLRLFVTLAGKCSLSRKAIRRCALCLQSSGVMPGVTGYLTVYAITDLLAKIG